jgi:hypothetical protein
MGKRIYEYHGIAFDKALSSDEQRSLAMLLRTKSWGKKLIGSSVAEQVTPVEPSKPKLTVVYERESSPRRTTSRVATPRRAARHAVTSKAKKNAAWEALKAEWAENIENETYVCRCGHKPFASLGTPEKGGALFHKEWTTLSGLYGKARSFEHFIPAIG